MSKQRKRLLLNDLTAERWYINMSTHRFDLSCYKYLREKMYKFHFNMYPFSFNFRGNNFFVAAYAITEEERNYCPEYALFRLLFMKQHNLDDTYELYINSIGVLENDPTGLRNYFDIAFDPNGYGFMDAFCSALQRQCPPDVEPIEDEELVRVERHSLCRKLDLDPEHCYRLSIMRLPQPKKRNANKYQLALKVFPHASKQYEDAMDVTYCFTDNPNDEVPEDVAIERFIQNEQKRKK
jgi:hypothetical protein